MDVGCLVVPFNLIATNLRFIMLSGVAAESNGR
jgi:hypothetical protein